MQGNNSELLIDYLGEQKSSKIVALVLKKDIQDIEKFLNRMTGLPAQNFNNETTIRIIRSPDI